MLLLGPSPAYRSAFFRCILLTLIVLIYNIFLTSSEGQSTETYCLSCRAVCRLTVIIPTKWIIDKLLLDGYLLGTAS